MPRYTATPLSSNAIDSKQGLFSQIRQILDSLEDQSRRNALLSSSINGKIEAGLENGDPIFSLSDGVLKIGMWINRQVRWFQTSDLNAFQGTNFVGWKTGTVAVTTASVRTTHFPNNRDWGFYERTGVVELWLCYNYGGGTLYKVQLT